MSNRHLPAGQHLQGAPGGISGVDMSHGPGTGGHRRRQTQYAPQYHQQQQQQHMPHMYHNYMAYAPQQYYGIPQQYNSSGGPSPGYVPYQNYARSPPAVPQYVPMVGVSVSPGYPRPSRQSPNIATSYQSPPAVVPNLPQTPSSTQSARAAPPQTPPTPQNAEQVPLQPVPPVDPPVAPECPPFSAPLPWLSRPESRFPKRLHPLKKIRRQLPSDEQRVSLPSEQHGLVTEDIAAPSSQAQGTEKNEMSLAETPAESQSQRDAVREAQTKSAEVAGDAAPQELRPPAGMKNGHVANEVSNGNVKDAGDANNKHAEAVAQPAADVAPVRAPPTSWAKLFSPPTVQTSTRSSGAAGGAPAEKGIPNGANSSDVPGANSSLLNKSSLAEMIGNFRVNSIEKASLIEPRGLINSGNMCYMNSILQVLMFCGPFYEFLERLSRVAAHNFKSETPLVDTLVVFMREFKVLASAKSSDQLRNMVKSEVFEKYGEPFTPGFVYEAIRQLSRFASMEHGHQQDAEEFLGFLLQTLDDECAQLMMNNKPGITESPKPKTDAAAQSDVADPSGDWLEVGRKQKSAVTRSSGSHSSTPITKVFGGLLRSEFRVPGLKDSITTEPYQPLQLDIGSPDVRNVVDALRGLTRPERLQGDFNSSRGRDVMATKQVFIETLPPVLILHLKRFQFDAEGHSTIKIWKKIGYPLELEIPREALSRQRRQSIGEGSMPRYRLISVVYHHGKNASGGHYTVDLRRQDGREWIRIDDTILRRIRSEDVAEAGSEDVRDSRSEHSPGSATSANRFGAINDEDGDEDGWKQVTASTSGNKKWSHVVNGNGGKEKHAKENIKDNRVAYLLFYQRV